MKILKTYNYDQFNFLTGNREIKSGHIKKVAQSIAKYDMTEMFPVVVDKDLNIIDGQHRYAACKTLELPIYYIILNDKIKLEYIQLLNSTSKNWNTQDYLDSFIQVGNQNYIKLADFIKNNECPLSVAVVLFSISLNGADHKESFKGGTFIYKNSIANIAKKSWELAKGLSSNAEVPLLRHKFFLRACKTIVKNPKISISKMVKKAGMSPYKIEKRATTTQYLRDLENIYNYKLRTKVRFY